MMDLSILVKELAAAVRRAKKVMSRRHPLPILGCVRIVSDPDDGVYLQATDLDAGVTLFLSGVIATRHGEAFIPVKELEGLLRGQTGAIRITVGGNPEEVTVGPATLRVPKVADWPATARVLQPQDGEVIADSPEAGAEVAAAIGRVTFAASTDDARPILTGVRFSTVDGHLRVAATDSYRMAWDDVDLPGVGKEPLLYPAKPLKALAAIVGRVGGVELIPSHKAGQGAFLQITGEHGIVILKPIDGTPANLEGLMRDTASGWVEFAPADLMAALAPLHTLAGPTTVSGLVRTYPHTDGMRLTVTRQDIGSATTEVEGRLEGDVPESIGLNYHYLREAVTQFKGCAKARISFIDNLKPVTFDCDEYPRYGVLQMPVRM